MQLIKNVRVDFHCFVRQISLALQDTVIETTPQNEWERERERGTVSRNRARISNDKRTGNSAGEEDVTYRDSSDGSRRSDSRGLFSRLFASLSRLRLEFADVRLLPQPQPLPLPFGLRVSVVLYRPFLASLSLFPVAAPLVRRFYVLWVPNCGTSSIPRNDFVAITLILPAPVPEPSTGR